ncbi:hypothetical protein GCM10010297_24460 [Streptomyces malachitofuscus]|nr:hypothetical protein GCM10010297_24460 [Streptomyces malachitofuscus]
MFARSGWRVRAAHPTDKLSRASPRTDTPDPAPHHPPTVGATRTPTGGTVAPQAYDHRPAAGVRPRQAP